MLAPDRFREISKDLGVPLPVVEKDYVMGWLLWAISNDAWLGSNLVLKGGNCLRKIYFADTRFSDDLDFTAHHLDAGQVFLDRLENICHLVSAASGVTFDYSRFVVEEKDTPDKDCKALDGRVYFKGFSHDSSVTMKVKFDVSDYEKIVLPTPRMPLVHAFDDWAECSANVLSYALEEVLAEKLRSWIQRTRPRDLFDVVKIIQSNAIPISKKQILSVFLQKTIYKGILASGRDELLEEEKFRTCEEIWTDTIICPVSAVMVAANAILLFKQFIAALFEPEVASAIGASLVPNRPYLFDPKSGVRESIIDTGRMRKLLRMRYHGKDRDIEPYSFRYKNGIEYFYGFDRTRGNTIKSFFLHEVQSVTPLPQTFLPRWTVEF